MRSIQYDDIALFFNSNSSRPKRRAIIATGVIITKNINPKITGLIILPISMPNLNQSLFKEIREDGDIKTNAAKINATINNKIAHKNAECQTP